MDIIKRKWKYVGAITFVWAFVMMTAVPATMAQEAVLVFRQQAAHGGEWVERVVQRFEEENPGVYVIIDDGGSGYLDQLTVQLLGGVAPDIFQGWGTSQRSWATNGLLLDMGPYLDQFFPDAADVFFPGQWQALQVEKGPLAGAQFGVPMYANVMGPILYNADMLAQAGVEPASAGWTWEDLAADAKRLTVYREGVPVRWGFVTETDHPGWIDAWMRSAGGSLFADDDRDRFTGYTAEALQALQFLNEMVVSEAMVPLPGQVSNEWRAFIAEDVALAQVYSSHAARNVGDTTFFDWDILPSPIGPTGLGPAMTVVDAYSINAETKHPELAVKFVMALKSAEASRDQVREKAMIPSTRYPELYFDVAESLPGKNMVAYLEVMNHAVADARVFYTKPSETQQILLTSFRDIFRGITPPGARMEAARRQLDAILFSQ